MFAQLVDHLWQSTLFAAGAGLLTALLRRNSAGVRYGLWFAASVKFLVPFALLAAAGGALASRLHLTLLPPPDAAAGPTVSGGLHWAPQMMAPASTFGALTPPLAAPAPHLLALRVDPGPILLGTWAFGLAVILLIWAVRWSRVRAALRQAQPIDLAAPIPALASPVGLEPGVVGLWRPVLLLPEGLAERLSPAEFDAVVAHELSHVRRRDNLTGAIHMLVQALFWFHPLVWWLGDRLIVERERACDEAVVRAGHDRETYAYGIVETCRHYLHLSLTCVAGASGSSLEMRVDEILSRPLSAPLSLEAKASIGMAATLALTIPLAAGLLTAPPITQRLDALVQAARVAPASSPAAAQASPRAVSPVAGAEPAPPTELAKPALEALAPPQLTVSPPSTALADIDRPIAEPPVVQIKPAPPEAAEAAPSPSGPVVSPATVETATPAEIRRQAYNFAQLFGATTVRLDQLARWTQPVCVSVQGLAADGAAKVTGRVRELAGDLGIGAQPSGCKPNIQIMFTDKPQALLDKVVAKDEHLLGYYHRSDRDRLKTVTHPIQAWYVTATGGDGGNVIGLTFASGATAPGPSGRAPHGLQIDDEDNTWWGPTGCGDKSKFTACLSSEFQSVLVVVDTGKAQDAGLGGPIADYVAMLAMAQPRSLDSCGVLPSVIELFAKGCPGRAGGNGMTRADAAYLTALYKIDLQSRKAAQQRAIGDRMADLLLKTDGSAQLAAQQPAAGTARR
jgi:beta-lactamase regulating signal transducer with metallopeptidase domain